MSRREGHFFSHGDIDRLMHLIVAPSGHIERAGPTMCKLRPLGHIEGCRLLEVFELRRPVLFQGSVRELLQFGGENVSLHFRSEPHTKFKGIILTRPRGAGLLFNLSFGISAMNAVQDYDLSNSDFAPTDLTIEMLYLQEAK